MKYIIISLILLSSIVLGQAVPPDVDTSTINKITSEHANTRKFVSQELVRQREVFFKEIEDRAIYYEDEARALKKRMFWQLGLSWAGVVLTVVGIYAFLSIKLEKVRTDLLSRRVGEEIARQITRMQPVTETQPQPQPEVANTQTEKKPTILVSAETLRAKQQETKPQKKSWSEKRADKKAEKRKQIYLKQREKLVKQVKKLDGKQDARG